MHIAFPSFAAVPDLLAPLQLLVRRLMHPAPAVARQPVRVTSPVAQAAQNLQKPAMTRRPVRLSAALAQPVARAQRPLRVVHVMERGASRANAGRMVISGRMADVCAELDRLAAREATLH